MINKKAVFVVHGRNWPLNNALFQFLRALGLEPMEFQELIHKTGQGSPYILDVIKLGFAEAAACVVLMTGDDLAYLRPELRKQSGEPRNETKLTPQPRPNVLIELGMALALYDHRTVIVSIGGMERIPSDILGKHHVSLTNDLHTRQDLANRLANHCDVSNLKYPTKWEKSGDFSVPKEARSSLSAKPKAAAELSRVEHGIIWCLGNAANERGQREVSEHEVQNALGVSELSFMSACSSLSEKGLIGRIIDPYEKMLQLTTAGVALALTIVSESSDDSVESSWKRYGGA